MTGASGALYFVRTMKALAGHQVDVIISPHGHLTLKEETRFSEFEGSAAEWLKEELGEDVRFTMHAHRDQGASIASGSNAPEAMIIVPCTVKTLAGIAAGYASNLVERTADVMLKERRPLVLVLREAPYSLIHIKNMSTLTEAGATILPASPAFYQKPKTFDELGDFIAQRALQLVGIDVDLFEGWKA